MIVCACFGLGSSALQAASIADEVQVPERLFYRENAQGWYWYQDPEQEEEPEAVRIEPRVPTSPEPAPLSAQWVRKMLPRYKDLAWDNPTPENIETYFLIQRFAMDRSQEFSDVAQRVIVGNPYLDESARRPINTYGIRSVDRKAGAMMEKMLEKVAERAGLFFFFKSDCQFCEAQAPLIKLLETVNGFSVLAISIDGQSLQSVQFDDTREDKGQARQLNVTATPALFLVTQAGHFENLGQSIMSLEDLKRRILIGAVRAGVLSETDIQQTRPVMTPYDDPHNLSRSLQELMVKAQDEQGRGFDGFIEPKVLLGYLNKNRQSGEVDHAN